MKIICPNCNAKYEIKNEPNDIAGRNVRCFNCNQEWYEYNFPRPDKENTSDHINLKQLAREEYQILKANHNSINKTKMTTEVGNDIKFRIQESSEKLEESKQFARHEPEKISSKRKAPNAWTLIGFLTASILFALFSSLYIFNLELQKMFPVFQNNLLVYKMFIEQFIDIIQKLLTDIL